jgi:hypothetical protein
MRFLGIDVSLRLVVSVWMIVVSALMAFVPSTSASTISFSQACAGTFGGNPGDCLGDSHSGDPAISSASRGASFAETDNSGGINYSAQAAGTGVPGRFSLFAHAGGSSDGSDIGIGYASGSAIIAFSDVITIAGGTGTGFMRIPWATDGGVDLSGIAAASFGVTFCQLIRAGSQTGGIGCDGYPHLVDSFSASNPTFSKLFNLDFSLQYGAQPVDYVLNTTFGASAGVSAPSGIATSDFQHTGTIQAAQFFDSFGNLMSGVTITAQSGLDYLNPQASPTVPIVPIVPTIPEPASIVLLALGLAGIGFMRRGQT